MSNFTTRTLVICAVPAVIALISVYWFRKKKKFKTDQRSVMGQQTSSAENCENLDSLAECSLDSADTLSDASSFTSPEISEKSLRTKNFSLESATRDTVVKNDTFCIGSNSVTPQQPNSLKASPPQSSSSFPTHSALNLSNITDADDNIPEIGIMLYNSTTNDNSEKCNSLPFLRLANLGDVSKTDVDRHNLSHKVIEEGSTNEIFSRLMIKPNFNSNSIDPMEALEEILGFSPGSLCIVENGISHSDDSKENEASPPDATQTIETDSNDSHSSVLDENSLSFVSDDSDRQVAEVKNKSSLLSDFEESLCDELDKSCSPILATTASKLLSVFASDGGSEIVEEKVSGAEVNSYLAQAPVTKTESSAKSQIDDRCPNSVNSDETVQGEPCAGDMPSLDFPSEPKTNPPAQIEGFGDSSCDSSVTTPNCVSSPGVTSLSKSSTPIVSSPEASVGPSPVAAVEKLLNGRDSEISLGLKLSEEDPQIPEMDISEHLSGKSVSSLPATENENCSESSGWEAQDSQSDALSQSKSDETGLAGSKVPENSSGQYVYEFELPQELCGRLIGKHGKHVKSIKDRSHANVYIKRHPYDPQLKIVVVEGNRQDVNEALEIIRRKYPPSRYPMVTLVKTNMITSTNVLPESLQLHIPEGASCDVILSSLVSAGHFFLQQPTHPTYPSLSTLDQCMINCYSQVDTPLLPHPVEAGVICAAPVMSGWYRAQVIYVYDNDTDCELKFVDYGGFSQAPTSSLRQIRSDFMSLPFQASECYLANVRPVDPAEGWSAEATATFEELAQGQILQALLVEYASDGVPCVHLYRVQGISNMFINKELVERGLAVWVNNSHWDPH